MEIINRMSPGILTRDKEANWATINKNGRIYFTAPIARVCELKDGLFMHFMFDGKHWHFFTNDDSNGFKVRGNSLKAGAEIKSGRLVKKLTDGKEITRMFITKTKITQDHNELFRIKFEQ